MITFEMLPYILFLLGIIQTECAGIDPYFVLAIIDRESSFNPKAVGKHGELGLMQLSPIALEHLRELGYHIEDVFNERNNIRLGCAYIRWLYEQLKNLYKGDDLLFFIACSYNAGLTRVLNNVKIKNKPPNVEYGAFVMERRVFYRKLLGGVAHGSESLQRFSWDDTN